MNTGEQEAAKAPRKWNRALPFLAQQVIDAGYDLPLPYGAGFTFAAIEQDQILEELEVGFNGSNKELYEFVRFENATSDSDAVSFKADTWLFPFMNVFAMIGQTQGGADMDIYLDGNGMLDKLEINCGKPGPSPLCAAPGDRIF